MKTVTFTEEEYYNISNMLNYALFAKYTEDHNRNVWSKEFEDTRDMFENKINAVEEEGTE